MGQGESVKNYVINLFWGISVFILVVAGGAWYLQSSLVLVKHYDPYTHWAVLLFALPVLAGIIKRFLRISTPLISTLLGALLSAAILYPQYKKLWAVPPDFIDVGIYVVIVFGIGYIATQPIKTTFMIAFRLGKYSLSGLNMNKNNANKTGANKNRKNQSTPAAPTGRMSKTQRLQASPHGNMVAMLELMIGVCSLGLSIFSVFFLGGA